jgi:hypothetical protein
VGTGLIGIAILSYNMLSWIAIYKQSIKNNNILIIGSQVSGNTKFVSYPDGSICVFKVHNVHKKKPIVINGGVSVGSPEGNTDSVSPPRMVVPPRPTQLRIWMPVIISQLLNILFVIAFFARHRFPLTTLRRKAIAALIVAMVTWLIAPAFRIAYDIQGDYYSHNKEEPKGTKCFHERKLTKYYFYMILLRPRADEIDRHFGRQ